MLVFTDLRRTPELSEMAECLGIIDGQPFLIGEDGVFDREVNAFLRSLVDPSSPGRNTWRTYAYHLARFLSWLERQQIAWRAVDRSVLRHYYTQRRFSQKHPVSARTWNNIAAALTRFYEWAAMTGEIAKSPVTYRDIRSGRMTAAPGSQRARSAIMESVPASPVRYLPLRVYLARFRPAFGGTRTAERDRAFADLLISTGMRINEANSLLLGDLPDPDAVECRGKKTVPLTLHRGTKGRKVRVIRIPVHVLRTVFRYIAEDRENAVAMLSARERPAELWLSESGRPMKTARWHAVFRRASRRSGVSCTPHMLRHAFAIHQLTAMIQRLLADPVWVTPSQPPYQVLLRDPLRQLQRLLGHASMATTFIYLDCLEETDRLLDDSLGNWTVPLQPMVDEQ
ncbi:TPA: tyrosine-type recombinase/integrase [Klebsiella pneumoniae]|uniref:tyrosine-type recombinase/integrase n=1 Tax=Enterobacteriaceae TaxID=543 RepID=UPI00049ED546|nr:MULTISPECIES: tyrosine-type recombinase/integrase [Enterobacteriaceae]HDG7803479.1 tyrosine-type recombinase/integrase [Klebsiella quasipneumoniae]HDS4030304.1 tyrosine-type recombinase/integrase [Klebsiella pneumoniae subsp. pneumoniae]HDS4805951.1 tyrosine-type recombinase/integrase [Klebsiella pneumoniae subsp. ozaenae]HED3492366.1 tyrosine-type recombinase/integrase [Klebsiella variicola subsp. variicola]AUY22865.1 integrase domain-containing protein SAM domain-containing protein [Klebs